MHMAGNFQKKKNCSNLKLYHLTDYYICELLLTLQPHTKCNKRWLLKAIHRVAKTQPTYPLFPSSQTDHTNQNPQNPTFHS